MSFPNASVGNPEHIYQQYLQAFKKGVFNYIKEESDSLTQETIPRKYFSGGVDLDMNGKTNLNADFAMRVVHNFTASITGGGYIVRAGLAMFSGVKGVVDQLLHGTNQEYGENGGNGISIQLKGKAEIAFASKEETREVALAPY